MACPSRRHPARSSTSRLRRSDRLVSVRPDLSLAKAPFIFPRLAFTYIASACALCCHRTAPLGVVLLAPVAVVILFTDTLLDTAWLFGTLNAVVLLALAWHFRSAYRPLWSYPVQADVVRRA